MRDGDGEGPANRTVFVVIVLVGAALLGGWLVAGAGKEAGGGSVAAGGTGPATAGATPLPAVARIARRVERIRELRFRTRPVPRLVTGPQVRREALAQLDADYPPARRAADEEVLELLGLLAPGSDLRETAASVYEQQVAGFYDPRRGRLAVVQGASGGAALREITLAHELTHALEDQRFGLKDDEGLGVQDATTAYTSFIEGTATVVMNEYARRTLSATDALAELATGLAGGGSTGLPPYVEASLLFPYTAGSRFVAALHRAGGWRLVNATFARPPASTEQVLHPGRYLRVDPPARVALDAGPVLGPGWRRVVAGQLGEFDTAQLMRRGDAGRADDAAAGWGGGRYELWRGGPLPDGGCSAPCRRRDALVLGWRWDTARDARQATRALEAYGERALKATPAVPGVWALPDGAGALAMRAGARSTTLGMAPDGAMARRLAGSGP